MNELNNRANIQVNTILGRPLIVYEDHRYLLNVINHSLNIKNCIHKPPNLIYFDWHADQKISNVSDSVLKKLNLQNERSFFNFVEWDISSMDDDWLVLAIKLGLVNDVISIGVNDKNGVSEIEDLHGNKHNIFNMDHLWNGFTQPHGWLIDKCVPEFKKICDILGWGYFENGFDFKKDNVHPLIVDFDLDCFTTKCSEKTIPWPSYAFFELFSKKIAGINWTPQLFLQELIRRSEYVTIAFESGFCGGISESVATYQNLMEILEEVVDK